MNKENKKEDILQTLQSTTDEELIDEVYELLHPDSSVNSIAISDLPEELQHKLNRLWMTTKAADILLMNK